MEGLSDTCHDFMTESEWGLPQFAVERSGNRPNTKVKRTGRPLKYSGP